MPVLYHEGEFPPHLLNWSALIPLIGPASAALARYDGMLSAIPNSSILLSPLTTQEAVLSSRIEGTQATMGEVLQFEAMHEATSPERRNDILEVLNYRKAMREAETRLEKFPFSQQVIKDAHRVLLSGVRGQNKSPGEYRKIPNWIGPAGCDEKGASYVPIAAHKLPNAMSAWEKYAHQKELDRLVQLAILHVEFESLHPFLDGNGRLGRMLVPLYLWQMNIIQRPLFYISTYFEARRDEYYERLLAVSRDGDWTGWCRFFLEAVRVQAEDNFARAQAIFKLHDNMKRQGMEITRSQYTPTALDWIFERPIFKSSDFVATAGIPAPTARRLLTALQKHRVLKVLLPGHGRRASVIAYPALLNIAEGKEIF